MRRSARKTAFLCRKACRASVAAACKNDSMKHFLMAINGRILRAAARASGPVKDVMMYEVGRRRRYDYKIYFSNYIHTSRRAARDPDTKLTLCASERRRCD
jgi:hypothetical protein